MDNEYQQILPKISGYLEKKTRKKVMSSYKKYWFVLEGRLLLYYKSKDEYEAISPCKGSINLGPTSNVKPNNNNNGAFQIESTTTTITLRAETKEEQHKWMHALMSALNKKNDYKNLLIDHFRYSPTIPNNSNCLEADHSSENNLNNNNNNNLEIIEKLQKMGAKSYGVAPQKLEKNRKFERPISFSNESIHHRNKLENFRPSNSVESVNQSSSEGIYERVSSSDSVFANYEIIDYNDNKVKNNEENLYDDAENFNHNNSSGRKSVEYCEIEEEEEEDLQLTQEKTHVEKSKLKFFSKKFKSMTVKSDAKKPRNKIRKSESFLQKVWNKKSILKKSKNNKEKSLSAGNIEEIAHNEKVPIKNYDIPSSLLDIQQQTDNLQHLHHHSRRFSRSKRESEEIEMNNKDVPNLPPRNAAVKKFSYNKGPAPSIPPKLKNIKNSSSLDDILKDIDENKSITTLENNNSLLESSGSKVKDLIKRFNFELIMDEANVELRNKKKIDKQNLKSSQNNNHELKDLDKLLEELSKITTAPLLTPGITTSLINPEISDNDMKEMVLIAENRRLSEPDYDIPRPHRSLIILPKNNNKENNNDENSNTLKGTRFFGPIIKSSSDCEESFYSNRPITPPVDYSNLPSMTPDSLDLELDDHKTDYLRAKMSLESHKKNTLEKIRDFSPDSFNLPLLKHNNIESIIFTDSLDS